MASKRKLTNISILIILLATALLYVGLENTLNSPKPFAKNIKTPKKNRTVKNVTQNVISKDTIVYPISWTDLGNTAYVEKTHAVYGVTLFPIIPESVIQKQNKNIQLSGYVLPIDDETYVLSKNVMASCFFCGVGGAETIAGLNFKQKVPRLTTDTYLTIEGRLVCNQTNPDDWIYTIEEATIIKKSKE